MIENISDFLHFPKVEAVDEICKDLDFYIVNSGKDSPSVEEMETMVKRHGGRPVKFLSEFTYFDFIIISHQRNCGFLLTSFHLFF